MSGTTVHWDPFLSNAKITAFCTITETELNRKRQRGALMCEKLVGDSLHTDAN